jgi:hypothetical protein
VGGLWKSPFTLHPMYLYVKKETRMSNSEKCRTSERDGSGSLVLCGTGDPGDGLTEEEIVSRIILILRLEGRPMYTPEIRKRIPGVWFKQVVNSMKLLSRKDLIQRDADGFKGWYLTQERRI